MFHVINKLRNKSGSAAILHIIHILIIVVCFAFILGVIIVAMQNVFMSKVGNQAARTIALQSGIEASTPANYPGGDSAYITSSEIDDYLEECYSTLDMDNYSIYINGILVSPSSSIKAEKGEALTVQLLGTFEWTTLNFLPGTRGDKWLSFDKIVYGEYDRTL